MDRKELIKLIFKISIAIMIVGSIIAFLFMTFIWKMITSSLD